MEFFEHIPKDLINFSLVAIFSLLIGLEQRWFHADVKEGNLFGTDRTYTFIGILGYISYLISPNNLIVFVSAGFALLILLAIFYYYKIKNLGIYGLTSIILALITYSLTPLLYTKPIWMTILLVTVVLILTELKDTFLKLTNRFGNKEFITLAKFLVIAGIVLPLLPNKDLSTLIPMSPFKIWLVVVVISSISYASYLMQKFFFPEKGIFITSILGGLYSSTATTIVLAKKSKESGVDINQIVASIIMATAMMFLRVYIFAYIFNKELAVKLAIPMAFIEILTFGFSFFYLKFGKRSQKVKISDVDNKNPLEFKTALVFSFLFVLFAVITKYVLQYYGAKGLNFLALLVGVADIDPFLLSLFTGKYAIEIVTLATATLIAVTSNNVIKLIYALSMGSKAIRKKLIFSFSAIVLLSVFFVFLIE